MSLKGATNLFFKEYSVKTLELKGDYEIWVNDIEEYFLVSGFPQAFRAIQEYVEIDINTDYEGEHKEAELKARHALIVNQSRYAIYRSLGDTVKREIAKEHLSIEQVIDLWRAVRSCFYLQDEATVQQLRDDIARWDLEKAGGWNNFTEGLERYYKRLDVVAKERSFTPSDKLYKLYDQAFKFVDKRMKLIDKPTVSKQIAGE